MLIYPNVHYFLACDGSCATCSVGGDANKCLTCAANKIFTVVSGSDGTCTGNFRP